MATAQALPPERASIERAWAAGGAGGALRDCGRGSLWSRGAHGVRCRAPLWYAPRPAPALGPSAADREVASLFAPPPDPANPRAAVGLAAAYIPARLLLSPLGGVAGGVTFGLAGALLGASSLAACDGRGHSSDVALVTVAVGAAIGYLVGTVVGVQWTSRALHGRSSAGGVTVGALAGAGAAGVLLAMASTPAYVALALALPALGATLGGELETLVRVADLAARADAIERGEGVGDGAGLAHRPVAALRF